MTKEEIFKQCLVKKETLRNKNIAESKQKLSLLYKHSDILSLKNTLGELKINKAKLLLENKSTLEIDNNIKETKLKLLKLIKQYGLSLEYLEPNFSCKICNDNGIVNNKICSCLNSEYLNELLAFSETDLTKIPTLDALDTSVYSNKEEIEKLIKILSSTLNNSKFNTILFSGETGTGKTYISKSYLKTYILNNKLGLFIPSFNLNNELLKYHTTFDNKKSLNRYLTPDLLVIEDLGTENIYNNITKEYLLLILNERQEANKLTLFTTNLTLNDIKERYNERFFSRLLDKNTSLKYNFKGKDIRIN